MSAATLAALERELAIEMARADLECYAGQTCEPKKGEMPRYNIEWLNRERAGWMDQDEMARDVARAVRYLDLIGGLDRPVRGHPNIVSVSRALQDLTVARLHAADQDERTELQPTGDGAVGGLIGKRHATVGVELQPLGLAPLGEIVRVNVCPNDPDAFDLLSFAASFGGSQPLIVGPMEFVTILKHGHEAGPVVTGVPGHADGLNLHGTSPVVGSRQSTGGAA